MTEHNRITYKTSDEELEQMAEEFYRNDPGAPSLEAVLQSFRKERQILRNMAEVAYREHDTLPIGKRIPIVSLGEGTWMLLDELPTIMFFTAEELENLDEAPVPCDDTTHIHIKDLLELSHWNDSCKPIIET